MFHTDPAPQAAENLAHKLAIAEGRVLDLVRRLEKQIEITIEAQDLAKLFENLAADRGDRILEHFEKRKEVIEYSSKLENKIFIYKNITAALVLVGALGWLCYFFS